MRLSGYNSRDNTRKFYKYLRYRNGKWVSSWEGSPLPPVLMRYRPTHIQNMERQVVSHRSTLFIWLGELE